MKTYEAVWLHRQDDLAKTLAQTICGNKTAYQPAIAFFNSCKVFWMGGLQYNDQYLASRIKKKTELHFHWRHSSENICITSLESMLTQKNF